MISTPLQPFQVMRFIRLAAIIVLAAVTGKNNEDKNRNSSNHAFFCGSRNVDNDKTHNHNDESN